jgi:hypothetical protein
MSVEPTYELLMQHLRMYLLYFLGRFLLPDNSDDRVHTMYLPLLKNNYLTASIVPYIQTCVHNEHFHPNFMKLVPKRRQVR